MNRALLLLLGLIALAVVSFVCIRTRAPAIERDILERTTQELDEQGLSWAVADVDGRDLVLEGVSPSEEHRRRAIELALHVSGVRTVDSRLTVSPPEVTQAPAAQAGMPQEGPTALAESLEPDVAVEGTESLEAEKPTGAEPSCSQQLAELFQSRTILFATGSAEIDRASLEFLDQVAALASSCPDIRIEISGHSDSRGEMAVNLPLSQARADSAYAYLIRQGIAASRLSAVAYGESRPVADNATAEGQARNRRIELTVAGE